MRADILACYDNTWIDWLIRKVTGKKITHVAVQITDTLCMETGWFGVKLSKIDGKKFYRLRYNELTKKQQRQIVKFVMESVDKKYDYKLFIGIGINKIFGLNTNWDNPLKYICAELVVKAYRSVGIELLPYIPDNCIIPSDFMDSTRLVIGQD